MAGAGASRVVVNDGNGGLPARAVRAAVQRVLQRERRQATVAVTFVGKRRMRALNARYLRHDWPTDVLSFPLEQPDGSLAGDIYVCRYMAARQAREYHSGVRRELLRLIIHGTMHVLGWDHPEGKARVRSAMWRQQERHLGGLR